MNSRYSVDPTAITVIIVVVNRRIWHRKHQTTDAPTPAPRLGLAPHPRRCDKIYENRFLGFIQFILPTSQKCLPLSVMPVPALPPRMSRRSPRPLVSSVPVRWSHSGIARHRSLTREHRLCWYRRADGLPPGTKRLPQELPSFSTDIPLQVDTTAKRLMSNQTRVRSDSIEDACAAIVAD